MSQVLTRPCHPSHIDKAFRSWNCYVMVDPSNTAWIMVDNGWIQSTGYQEFTWKEWLTMQHFVGVQSDPNYVLLPKYDWNEQQKVWYDEWLESHPEIDNHIKTVLF